MEEGGAADPNGKGKGENKDITISIKFSSRSIPLTLSPDSTITHLKSFLQPLTNVLTRGQKLIFKGKVLVDTMTLRALEIMSGAKVMLMASQGLHQGAHSSYISTNRH